MDTRDITLTCNIFCRSSKEVRLGSNPGPYDFYSAPTRAHNQQNTKYDSCSLGPSPTLLWRYVQFISDKGLEFVHNNNQQCHK